MQIAEGDLRRGLDYLGLGAGFGYTQPATTLSFPPLFLPSPPLPSTGTFRLSFLPPTHPNLKTPPRCTSGVLVAVLLFSLLFSGRAASAGQLWRQQEQGKAPPQLFHTVGGSLVIGPAAVRRPLTLLTNLLGRATGGDSWPAEAPSPLLLQHLNPGVAEAPSPLHTPKNSCKMCVRGKR